MVSKRKLFLDRACSAFSTVEVMVVRSQGLGDLT